MTAIFISTRIALASDLTKRLN